MEQNLTKQAAAEIFVKLATANNIDLSRCSEEQVAGLWSQVFGTPTEKVAAQTPDPTNQLVEQANLELQVKQAAEQRVRDAYLEGEIMAQGFFDKLASLQSAAPEAAAAPAAPEAPATTAKEASALNRLAAQAAVKIASDAGFETQYVAARLEACHTLGMFDDDTQSKVASARSTDEAAHIRALELLEVAGFPVTWGPQA